MDMYVLNFINTLKLYINVHIQLKISLKLVFTNTPTHPFLWEDQKITLQ